MGGVLMRGDIDKRMDGWMRVEIDGVGVRSERDRDGEGEGEGETHLLMSIASYDDQSRHNAVDFMLFSQLRKEQECHEKSSNDIHQDGLLKAILHFLSLFLSHSLSLILSLSLISSPCLILSMPLLLFLFLSPPPPLIRINNHEPWHRNRRIKHQHIDSPQPHLHPLTKRPHSLLFHAIKNLQIHRPHLHNSLPSRDILDIRRSSKAFSAVAHAQDHARGGETHEVQSGGEAEARVGARYEDCLGGEGGGEMGEGAELGV